VGGDRVDFVFGMDNNAALRRVAEALDPAAWKRLERAPAYQSATGITRARRTNTKRQIVKDPSTSTIFGEGSLRFRVGRNRVTSLDASG
jgi:hypothetical protein